MAGFAFAQPDAGTTGAMVVLFERDDSIAVPLLSHIRMAGYDVRVARTPVDLFDLLGKHQVGLVIVDLGSATAGRREFWVALDSKRSGTNVQVLTFRLTETTELQEGDSLAATAVPDVRIHSRNELHLIVDGVRERLASGAAPLSPQLNSALGALSTMIPMGGGPSQWDPGGFGGPLSPSASSVFAQPSQVNPFADPSGPPSMASPFGPPSFAASSSFAPADSSPFAAPLAGNPFLAPGTPVASTPPNAWQGSDPGRGPAAPSSVGGQSGVYGSGFNGSASQVGKPSIADAWVPPDGGAAVASASAPTSPHEEPTPHWDDAIASASMVRRPFEPAPPPVKPAPKLSPDEVALSEVLMDGALISPETLDVLKGVRQMLEAVNMRMNIGELAMLFRFLSPDQLLAAILVSRGLVSPKQIAHLGRKKQDLAAEGKDYTLETLVAMSGLISNEQLAQIRQEIGLARR